MMAFTQSCSLELIGAVGGNKSADDSDNAAVSTATLTLQFPDLLSDRLGYSKWFYGDCSHNGKTVEVLNGATSLGSALCTGGKFSIYADTSSLALGNHILSLEHADDENLIYSINTGTLNKFSTACDLLVNRQNNFAAGLAGGTGTWNNPYLICTSEQLQEMSGHHEDFMSLANDLYLSFGDTNGDTIVDGSDLDYLSGAGWTPVDDGSCCGFLSGLYGNRFAIEGLVINQPASDNIGLFDSASHMFFKELRFYDAQINGRDQVGALLGGMSADCSFHDLHLLSLRMQSTVSGRNEVGGIVGGSSSTALWSKISVEADITGTGTRVGGVTGYLAGGAFHWVKMTGNVVGVNKTGGLLGAFATGFNLTNSYSTASVTGTTEVGGLIGSMGTVIYMDNTYSTGDVTGTGDYVGGLFGNIATGRIQNSFSLGSVQGASATNEVGLLIGNDNFLGLGLTLTNVYVSSSATCTDLNAGGGSCNSEGTATALAQFIDPNAVVLDNWDFENDSTDGPSDVWHVTSGSYPQLYFEKDQSDYLAHFSGTGTVSDPYLIDDETDFGNIRSNPRYAEAALRLNANIDYTLVPDAEPLFRSGVFVGDFNGNDFTISNYSRTETTRHGTGFFHHATMARIYDFTLHLSGNVSTPGDMNYKSSQGGISSLLFGDSRLSRVSVIGTGSIRSPANGGMTGGICAECVAFIDRCAVEVDIFGSNSHFGGLVGLGTSGAITNSYHRGDVTGGNRVGGVWGMLQWNTIVDASYHVGTVTGSSGEVGGIGGSNFGITVTNSFSNGNVIGNDATAIVGYLFGFTAGVTAGASNYYLNTALCNNIGGGGCSAWGTGNGIVNTFQIPGSGPLNWDFGTIWIDNSGSLAYPTLQ